MIVSVRPSKYGCTSEVQALEARVDSYASLVLSNLPLVSITLRTLARHEPIVNYLFRSSKSESPMYTPR